MGAREPSEPKSAARSEGASFKGIEREVADAAAPQLEGETARVVYVGTTGMSFWLILALLVPLNLLLLIIVPLTRRQGRGVVVTDRAVHVFHINTKRVRIKRKVATLSRPVEVELTRWGLTLGDERKIYSVGTSAAMKEAAALAKQPPS